MAGDADSDSNTRPSPESGRDEVERAQVGDSSTRDSAEQSDARSNLSNEAVREFENRGSAVTESESQGRQDTASQHLPGLSIEGSKPAQPEQQQQPLSQMGDEQQSQQQSENRPHGQPPRQQHGDQANEGQRQHPQDNQSADSAGDAQRSQQRNDNSNQRSDNSNQRNDNSNQRSETPQERNSSSNEHRADNIQSGNSNDQSSQSPNQNSETGAQAVPPVGQEQQRAERNDQMEPQPTQDVERNNQDESHSNHESAHANNLPEDQPRDQTNNQIDQTQDDANHQNQLDAQHEQNRDQDQHDQLLQHEDGHQSDSENNHESQQRDSQDQQNDDRESNDQNSQLPDIDPGGLDGANQYRENEQHFDEDNKETDRLPELDRSDSDRPNESFHESEHEQGSDKLPDIDPGGLQDQPGREAQDHAPENHDAGQSEGREGTQARSEQSEHSNSSEPNHAADGNHEGTAPSGHQNRQSDETHTSEPSTSPHAPEQGHNNDTRSESSDSHRPEALERPSSDDADIQASSKPASEQSFDAPKDLARTSSSELNQDDDTKPNTAAMPVAGPSDPVDRVSANAEDGPRADAVSSPPQNSEKVDEAKSVEPVRDLSNAPTATSSEGEVQRNSIVANFMAKDSNDAPPQPDGDDSPSQSSRDSKPDLEDKLAVNVNPNNMQAGFVSPGFAPSAAAAQFRSDAQIGALPIRPLSSGFLEKSATDRTALNAMALNPKLLQAKFAGESNKIGKDTKGLSGDRRSAESGLKGTDARFDPRFAGNSKIEGKAKSILKRRLTMSGEKHYLTGIEIALAAAITAAAIAKKRNGVSDDQAVGQVAEQQLAELLNDLNPNDKAKNSKDSSLYRSSVNHYKRPTHLVQPNESLISIAEGYFADSDVAWLIADLNAGLTNEYYEDGKRIVELRSRIEIELPLPSEITEFFAKKQKDQKGESIITIIKESEIDAELLNSFLGTVVGVSNAPTAQLSEPMPLNSLINQAPPVAVASSPASMNSVLGSGDRLSTFVSGFALPNVSFDQD